MKLFYYLLPVLFCALTIPCKAQETNPETVKTEKKADSVPLIVLTEHLMVIKANVEKLNIKVKEIQQKIDSDKKKSDSLLKVPVQDELIKTKQAELKKSLSDNDTLLKLTGQELQSEKINQDAVYNLLKDEIAKLEEAKGGTADPAKKTAETESDKLKTLLAAIAAQEDIKDLVAQIEMNDSLKVFSVLKKTKEEAEAMIKDPNFHKNGYEYDGKRRILKVTKVAILKVHILAKEGIMREIVVTTNLGIFRNKSAVIDLVHLDSRTGDTLRYQKQKYYKDGDYRYIFLDDVISYTPVRSFNDLPYADFDITLTPDKEHRMYLLKESTSINSYVNVSGFTDIKGISGEPNAIAQFNAEAKFITNTRNFRNGAIVPLNYISFMGGLSKYDTKFKGSMLMNKDSISRKDLFQRSSYSVGFKLNLLHGLPSPYPHHLINDWQLNIGYNFVGSKVSDTTFKDKARTIIDTTFRTVVLNQWYLEPKITFSRGGNFAFTLGVPFHVLNIKESAKIKNDRTEYWASPSIELMYFGKKDSASKLFFRYYHFINLKDSSQAFNQIQLGYSLSLTSVWNK